MVSSRLPQSSAASSVLTEQPAQPGQTRSKFEPLGADADSTPDGLNVHGAIVDELHARKTR